MKIYRYSSQFHSEHHKYALLIFSCIILLFALLGAIFDFQNSYRNLGGSLLIILMAFASAIHELHLINMYPDITLSAQGLGIKFLGRYLPVSWENIESLHLVQSSFHPVRYSEWFVRTRKLTPLHLLYGKSKYGDYVTGFLIRSEMENVQQVLDEIKRKLPEDKYQSFYKS